MQGGWVLEGFQENNTNRGKTHDLIPMHRSRGLIWSHERENRWNKQALVGRSEWEEWV